MIGDAVGLGLRIIAQFGKSDGLIHDCVQGAVKHVIEWGNSSNNCIDTPAIHIEVWNQQLPLGEKYIAQLFERVAVDGRRVAVGEIANILSRDEFVGQRRTGGGSSDDSPRR